MTILVQVEVDVTPCGKNKLRSNVVGTAVKAAIRDCLERGEQNGFNHPLDTEISLSIRRIDATGTHISADELS